MRAALRIAVCFAAAVPTAWAEADLPAPLAAAIKNVGSQPISYDVTLAQQTNTISYTVNPTVMGADRVTAVSPPEKKLDQRERALIQRARMDTRAIWCGPRYLKGATEVQLMREDAASAVYSFKPSLDQMGGGQGPARAGQNGAMNVNMDLRGEVTVLKAGPDVSEIHFAMSRPINTTLFRLDKFAVSVHCEPAESGRYFAAETTTEFVGSAFLSHINVRSVERIANVQLPDELRPTAPSEDPPKN